MSSTDLAHVLVQALISRCKFFQLGWNRLRLKTVVVTGTGAAAF